MSSKSSHECLANGMASKSAVARWAGMKHTFPTLLACAAAAALSACTDTTPVADEANDAVPAAIVTLPPDVSAAHEAAAANYAANEAGDDCHAEHGYLSSLSCGFHHRHSTKTPDPAGGEERRPRRDDNAQHDQ